MIQDGLFTEIWIVKGNHKRQYNILRVVRAVLTLRPKVRKRQLLVSLWVVELSPYSSSRLQFSIC